MKTKLGLLGIMAGAILSSSLAHAADIIGKVPPVPFSYPAANGWYGIVSTEGGGGSASVSAPGVNQNSLITNSASIYAGLGYAWQVGNSPVFVADECKVGYTNFNGAAAGLSFQGPITFHCRALIGAPIDKIVEVLPINLQMPTWTAPTGETVKSTRFYFGPGFYVSDNSLAFAGSTSGKEWQFAPSWTPVGMLVQLSSGGVVDVHSDVRINMDGLCTSSALGKACGRPNTEVLAGLDYKFGLTGLKF
jgi:hypothetical protein